MGQDVRIIGAKNAFVRGRVQKMARGLGLAHRRQAVDIVILAHLGEERAGQVRIEEALRHELAEGLGQPAPVDALLPPPVQAELDLQRQVPPLVRVLAGELLDGLGDEILALRDAAGAVLIAHRRRLRHVAPHTPLVNLLLLRRPPVPLGDLEAAVGNALHPVSEARPRLGLRDVTIYRCRCLWLRLPKTHRRKR